jgi:uncharacterized protein
MNSAIYEGVIVHNRYRPVKHRFIYHLFMMYLDLDELDHVFKRRILWSSKFPTLARFRRKDFLGDPSTPLPDAVRDAVENQTGQRPTGPIRLLTQLRYFGIFVNPVCFYYCFDASGTTVESVVAEVTNTPWGEKHVYVWPGAEAGIKPDQRKAYYLKAMHVSPFMGMDQHYRCTLTPPRDILVSRIQNIDDEGRIFEATLGLQRKPLTTTNLTRMLLNYPFMTAQIALGIYFQAFRLWRRRIPFVSHPDKKSKHEEVLNP